VDPQLNDPKFWDYFGFKPCPITEVRPDMPMKPEYRGYRHEMAKNVGVSLCASNVQLVGISEKSSGVPEWVVMISQGSPLLMVRLVVRAVLHTYLEQATE
jgi:hypothetical protein